MRDGTKNYFKTMAANVKDKFNQLWEGGVQAGQSALADLTS